MKATKLIEINGIIYKVSQKEFVYLQSKKQEIENMPNLKDVLTEGFNLYLKSAIGKYKEIGELSLIVKL